MKNVKMVQILFILLCLLGYRITTAQSDYVVTSMGDTLMGTTKYLNYGVHKSVQLVRPNKEKEVFTILQVKSFRSNNEEYHNIRTAQDYTFMKVIKSGYLSLYTFQLPNQQTWGGNYIQKRDGTGMEIPTFNFKKQMTRYLGECREVAAAIQSGELSRGMLDEIINRFNNCIEANTGKEQKVITAQQSEASKVWVELETVVNNLAFFAEKQDALEMIKEIRSKVDKTEKVPNFLIEGIQEILKSQSSVQPALTKALAELNK